MTAPAIEVRGLGKRFRIGAAARKADSLRELVHGATRRLVMRNRSESAADATIWALRDVSFELKPGEVLGIVGKNGAGKSTLLKILSRITEPTEGDAVVRGRVASLLEVGTGFHPELSGRENIFLNGAILGMTRAEIREKFDEIVAFSEVERFIDTPVKRYSSGMYTRLAFAVAAHLEPEILVVDEVLAVGDAEFQKKCLGKMRDVATTGRTILFVSHNLSAVRMLCPTSLLLEGGRVARLGDSDSVLAQYASGGNGGGGEHRWRRRGEGPGGERVWLGAIRILSDGRACDEVPIDRPVEIEAEVVNEAEGARLYVNVLLADAYGVTVLETANTPGASIRPDPWFCKPHPAGRFRYSCTLPGNFLNEGRYVVSFLVGSPNPPKLELQADRAISFQVVETGAMRTPGFPGRWGGVVRVPLEWRGECIDEAQPGREAEELRGAIGGRG